MVGFSNIINKKSSTTIPKVSFVAPSPSCNHSMLHQTFYPPHFRTPQSLNPYSATISLLPPPPPPPPLSLPEVERNPNSMEAGAAAVALQAAPPALEELEPEFVIPDDVNWAVEHATMLDGFLVDDLLNFNEAELEEIKQENAFEPDTPTPTAAAVQAAASTDDIFEPAPPLSPFSGLWSHNPEEFDWMASIIDESMVVYPPSAAVPTFIPTTREWLPAVKRARRTEGLRVPCSTWPCPFKSNSSGSGSGSSTTTVSTSSSSSSQNNTQNLFKYGSYQFDQPSKKPSRKPKNHQLPRAAAGGAGGSSYGERSCTHCGSQKTPQWRLGPMGPKTLCNACGVRYKSGRLVPEYRPAASPSFIPQVHSSSHRKVMEMRRQKEMEAAAPPPPMTTC